MGIIARVARATRELLRADYSQYDGLTESFAPPDGGHTPQGASSWVRYCQDNPRLQSAIRRLATDVSSVKYSLATIGTDGKQKAVNNHLFNEFMERPWVQCLGGTWQELLCRTQGWLDLVGHAFWLILRSGNQLTGQVTSVIPIPPQYVTVFILPSGKRDVVVKYQICLPGVEIPEDVPAENMIWFRDPFCLGNPQYQVGLAHSLGDEVMMDEAASKFNNAFFRNGASPHVIVSVLDKSFTQAQLNRLRSDWAQRYQGVQNAFRTLFLSADTKVTPFSPNQRDMQYTEGRKFARDTIFQTFNLPPEVMGVVENSNRATAEAAIYIYSLKAVLPRVDYLASAITRQLIQPYFLKGKKVFLAYENPVRETEEFRLDKAERLFKCGAINRDQCLVINGYDPVGGVLGKQFLQPANTWAVTEENPNPPTPSKTPAQPTLDPEPEEAPEKEAA